MARPRHIGRSLRATCTGFMVAAGCAAGQVHDSTAFAAPPPSPLVSTMLTIAQTTHSDVVYDIGSDQAQLVVAAARYFGTRGVYVDPDTSGPALDGMEGIYDRIGIVSSGLFDADLSEATVIALWSIPASISQLQEKIMADLRPGARIVAQSNILGSWEPDSQLFLDTSSVFLWTVPANVSGVWRWVPALDSQAIDLRIKQSFQNVEMSIDNRDSTLYVCEADLKGDRLLFAVRAADGTTLAWYHGIVRGNSLKGLELIPDGARILWRANRDPTTMGTVVGAP